MNNHDNASYPCTWRNLMGIVPQRSFPLSSYVQLTIEANLFFFNVVLWIKLKVLCVLGNNLTSWAMSPAKLCLLSIIVLFHCARIISNWYFHIVLHLAKHIGISLNCHISCEVLLHIWQARNETLRNDMDYPEYCIKGNNSTAKINST